MFLHVFLFIRVCLCGFFVFVCLYVCPFSWVDMHCLCMCVCLFVSVRRHVWVSLCLCVFLLVEMPLVVCFFNCLNVLGHLYLCVLGGLCVCVCVCVCIGGSEGVYECVQAFACVLFFVYLCVFAFICVCMCVRVSEWSCTHSRAVM